MPYTESDEPIRIMARKLSVDPRCTKSRTEILEPSRPSPYTEIAEERRAKLRIEIELPTRM
jgi:hypothetical protein